MTVSSMKSLYNVFLSTLFIINYLYFVTFKPYEKS